MREFNRNRTLQDLEGEDWGEPNFSSALVINLHRLRRIPLTQFSVEDLRLMIGQQQSLAYLIPLAIEQLSHDPLSEGDYYLGDLLCAVLRIPDSFWQQHPIWRQQLPTLIYQAIDRLNTLQQWERKRIEEILLSGLEQFA